MECVGNRCKASNTTSTAPECISRTRPFSWSYRYLLDLRWRESFHKIPVSNDSEVANWIIPAVFTRTVHKSVSNRRVNVCTMNETFAEYRQLDTKTANKLKIDDTEDSFFPFRISDSSMIKNRSDFCISEIQRSLYWLPRINLAINEHIYPIKLESSWSLSKSHPNVKTPSSQSIRQTDSPPAARIHSRARAQCEEIEIFFGYDVIVITIVPIRSESKTVLRDSSMNELKATIQLSAEHIERIVFVDSSSNASSRWQRFVIFINNETPPYWSTSVR